MTPALSCWPEAQHIYLSPHLDDVVLSCGGMIAMQARRGASAAVITVCAGSPPEPLPRSPIITQLHHRWQEAAQWGTDFRDAPGVRRAEDIRAIRALGESIQVVHLDLLDCIYRLDPNTGEPLYPVEESLNAPLQPGDPILADLRHTPPLPRRAMLYVPLTLGKHVDHQAVRSAAEGWGIPPEQMSYYEDYPYAATPGLIEAAVEDSRQWKSQIIPLDEEALAAKIRAIAVYESQLTSFWPDTRSMETAIRDFAARRGGERLWTSTPRLK